MFKIHELRELIKLVDQSSVQEFDMEHEGSKITIKKQGQEQVVNTIAVPQVAPAAVPQAPAPVAPKADAEPKVAVAAVEAPVKEEKVIDKNLHQIKSPMVGTFYAAPTPDSDPYVKIGDKIDEKSIVCIVEAMKLFNEIEAEVKGEIVEILVENAQLVEYGQPLFLVKVD